LIRKVWLLVKLLEDKTEKKSLEVKVHPSRPIDADEAGMERNIGQHSFRAERILRSTEILAIPRDENPVLIEQILLQLSVLPA
jgi:hypothetical protein